VSAETHRIFFGATFYAIFSAHAAHDNDMAESVSSPRSDGHGPPRASPRIDGVDGVRRYGQHANRTAKDGSAEGLTTAQDAMPSQMSY
jgi:hypothetical protein